VIRDQLAAFDDGPPMAGPGPIDQDIVDRNVPAETGNGRLRPALVAVVPTQPSEVSADPADLRLSRDDLLAHAGLTEATLAALEQYGVVAERPGGGYDADALEIATAAARLAEYGLEARHLRAYRAAADREIGLFTQLVAPLARQNGPAARARAAETVRELAACTERLHAALVRSGLRETLGR
jgi:hypothetical protein